GLPPREGVRRLSGPSQPGPSTRSVRSLRVPHLSLTTRSPPMRTWIARLKKLLAVEDSPSRQRLRQRRRPLVENLEQRVNPVGLGGQPVAVPVADFGPLAEDGPAAELDIGGIDNNEIPAQLTFTIKTLPDWGTLLHNDVPVYPGQSFFQDGVDGGGPE